MFVADDMVVFDGPQFEIPLLLTTGTVAEGKTRRLQEKDIVGEG